MNASPAALLGRGRRPGEIELARRGVLVLDGLAHFRPAALATLKGPMDSGEAPLVVGILRPCPCGWRGDRRMEPGRCHCSPGDLRRHWRPVHVLLDRFDVSIEVPTITFGEMRAGPGQESSGEVKRRILEAWALRTELGSHRPALRGEAESLLQRATEKLRLSARVVGAVVRVARTLACLAKSRGELQAVFVAEAIQYRPGLHIPGPG